MSESPRRLRVVSVIASVTAGGIGPVCRYAADAVAKLTDWEVTLLSLHDPVGESREPTGLKIVSLGITNNAPALFLNWLKLNPQDVVLTSDVSHIEAAFEYLPKNVCHIIHVHDFGRRYRKSTLRYSNSINGVMCIAQHIEERLKPELKAANFQGIVGTVYNGANFPAVSNRCAHEGPLRLLFMGRLEPLKGVFDLVPLLLRLRKLNVPVKLNLVGGQNDVLKRQFEKHRLDCVEWFGRVSHERCYEIAAASDIFLMPSRKESFGMVTIEAMSMGCVPMAYNIPSGSTEIIRHNKDGLLVPLGNTRVWAAEINELHKDRKLLRDLSAGAIRRARERFNAEVMGGNLASFVKNVINQAGTFPVKRIEGVPPAGSKSEFRRYQRLPVKWREWIRNRVFSHPKLSYWLLNR